MLSVRSNYIYLKLAKLNHTLHAANEIISHPEWHSNTLIDIFLEDSIYEDESVNSISNFILSKLARIILYFYMPGDFFNSEKIALNLCNTMISHENKIDNALSQKQIIIGNIALASFARKDGNFNKAEYFYAEALKLFETHSVKDDQYFRLKNALAKVIDMQPNREEDANKIFYEVYKYWNQSIYNSNPYAAMHFISYAKHKLKHGLLTHAALLIEKAISINKNNSEPLVFFELPQLCIEIYNKLPTHEQTKNKILQSYVIPKLKPKAEISFWNRNKKTIIETVAIASMYAAYVK